MLLFDEIIKHIYALDEPNIIVYIAVGSSAGSVKYDVDKNTWKIEPQFEQQFPPFLSALKMNNYMLPTHIILIDSLLEDPPFVTCDSKRCISEDWCKNDSWYYNTVTNTYVYPIKINVAYAPFWNKDQTNIDDFLQQINLCAMEKNWFVVFHDFCGRDVGKIAEYFDNMIEGHHDHIIYGIGARFDGGCFIDLTLPECQFEYFISENGIKAFNPYQYKYRELGNIFNNTNSDTIKAQIRVMVNNIELFFKNNFYSLIRQIGLLKNGEHITIYEQSYSHIENLYMINIREKIERKEYTELLDNILCVLQCELGKHVGDDIVKFAINEMLKESDLYKWTFHLEKVFKINL